MISLAEIHERMQPKISPEPNSGCWLWAAAVSAHGYGKLTIGKVRHLAHRLAWEVHRGSIPPGLCVLHVCDTPACCNPSHLWLGTRRDNMVDMVKKGRNKVPTPGHPWRRGAPACGENNPRAKLTSEQVALIRRNERAASEDAKLFGVSKATIYRIRSNKIWRSVSVAYPSSGTT